MLCSHTHFLSGSFFSDVLKIASPFCLIEPESNQSDLWVPNLVIKYGSLLAPGEDGRGEERRRRGDEEKEPRRRSTCARGERGHLCRLIWQAMTASYSPLASGPRDFHLWLVHLSQRQRYHTSHKKLQGYLFITSWGEDYSSASLERLLLFIYFLIITLGSAHSQCMPTSKYSS